MRIILIHFLLVLSVLSCKQAPTMIDGFVQSGNNKIYFESKGEGETIVFVHGGAVDLQMWQKQVATLSADYRVIVYDLRGHGKSDYQDNQLKDAEDLKALLDHLDVEKMHLAGLSLGAIVALDFALAYPDYIKKLVLLSPGLAGIQEQDSSYLQPIMALGAALQVGDIEKATDIVEQITFYGRGERLLPKDMDSTVSYVRKRFKEYIESNNFTRLPQFIETNPASRLDEIDVPTLLIHGDQDSPYIGNNVRVLSDGISNSQSLLIKDAGHLVNIEQASAVNRALINFLGK